MFKKSRKRIVAAIMSVLTLLWVGTLCVIYISSYFEVTSTNREMLKGHAEMFEPIKPMGDILSPIKPMPHKNPQMDTNQFKLSTFYTVAISHDSSIIEVRNDKKEIFTDAELEEKARLVLKKKDDSGVVDNLVYYKMEKDSYMLVAFMDNTIIRESMNTLFRYTLIFGGVAIVALYFLAVYLAKKIVKPLEESYQKQKQFISDAGHELKTPISVISANAELLSRETENNRWLSNIQYENERMGRLVAQLLELARTENVEQQFERVDLTRLVAGGALPFESVAFENGLTLNTEIENGITVFGNSTKLSQLISILIDNAIKYSQNGNEVAVRLSLQRNFAILTVVNTANPIPKEHISRLFERFYRLDQSRSSGDNSYGLGLAIAKAIVDNHHGKIEVSCLDGKVYFCVKIPKI